MGSVKLIRFETDSTSILVMESSELTSLIRDLRTASPQLHVTGWP